VHGAATEAVPTRELDDDLDEIDSTDAEIDEDYDRAYDNWTAEEEVTS